MEYAVGLWGAFFTEADLKAIYQKTSVGIYENSIIYEKDQGFEVLAAAANLTAGWIFPFGKGIFFIEPLLSGGGEYMQISVDEYGEVYRGFHPVASAGVQIRFLPGRHWCIALGAQENIAFIPSGNHVLMHQAFFKLGYRL